MRGWPGMVLLGLLAVGIAGGAIALAGHASDDAFTFMQKHPAQLEPLEVARLVAKGREPVPGGHGSSALEARCTPGHKDQRRDSWLCRVRYVSGARVTYKVTIAPNGSVRGVDPTGERLITGCCLPVGE